MISILIPTYNRPSYLKRLLGYYSDYEVDYNLIVADGSSDEIKRVNKETVSSFLNLKIQHLDEYSSETHPFHRIADALKYVNTKYCVLCADDDFITPNGINQSVNFLEKNPDFAVAYGRYIGFYLKDDERGKRQFCWRPAYSRESITFSDPAMRLNYHLSNYLTTTFYAVHRTGLLKMIWAERMKFIDGVLFSELLLSMLTSIYGKMKCLDVLYAARDEDSVIVSSWPNLRDAIEAGTYDEEYAKFRDCLSTHLSKQSQLNMEESRKVVDDAMLAYGKKYHITEKIRTESRSRMRYVLDSLNLPDWADKGIRRLYAELIRWKYMWKHTKKHFVEMPSSSQYRGDFDRIRLHVLSYAKTKLE